MSIAAFLFDLDGTLADSLADIADAMDHVLTGRGLAAVGRGRYREVIGGGVTQLVERVVAAPAERAAVLAGFRARYGERLLVETRPYLGVDALLDELARRGVAMAVVSNKPAPWTEEVVARLFPGRFAAVLGQSSARPAKPDPAMALAAAEALGVAPARCAYVGDTAIDVATARAAGMLAVGVAWGFRPEELGEAARVVQRPMDLLDLLQVPDMTQI